MSTKKDIDMALVFYNLASMRENFQKNSLLALKGCDLAESIANSHQSRPCFKKIDHICARLKQDIVRQDNVMANINSQGIPWAIKDLIFVFTRIINAWTIIKGYVYETPSGLNRVKSTFSPKFEENFIEWEAMTFSFVHSLIESFTSLDKLHQTQCSATHKNDSKIVILKNPELQPERFAYYETLNRNGKTLTSPNSSSSDGSNDGKLLRTGTYQVPINKAFLVNEMRQVRRMKGLESSSGNNQPNGEQNSAAARINQFLRKICDIEETIYFFSSRFTKNYFPDFLTINPNFFDLRSIILKRETGGYMNLDEVIMDLRQIIRCGESYLRVYPNEELAKCVSVMENGLNSAISEENKWKLESR